MRDQRFEQAEIAVFEDRVVFEAPPPVSDAEIARIEAKLSGPIPPDLLALWRTGYGGELDYDLDVSYGAHVHAFSFSELFYPGNNGYFDLDGWIAREGELAAEQGGWSGKLDFLPFGGFEYLDRLYVRVTPEDYGAVYAFSAAIPPAWALYLHKESFARVFDNVRELFRSLYLKNDPRAFDLKGFPCGVEMLKALDEAGARRAIDSGTLTGLRSLVQNAWRHWRGALAGGTLHGDPCMERLALTHAASHGDVELLDRLRSNRIDMSRPLRGTGTALEVAMVSNQHALANRLLDLGFKPHAEAFGCARGEAPIEILRRLHAAGAAPHGWDIIEAVNQGQTEKADLMTSWLIAAEPEARRKLIEQLRDSASSEERSAERIDSGQMTSNVPATTSRLRAETLRAFAASLEKP